MNILEQSCKAPREHRIQRIMILCDRDGFANMKDFLFNQLGDCTSYIDSITERMEDFFVMTESGDYFVSCEDHVFYNIVNIILCSQNSSNPLKNIPSIFYDLFVNDAYKKHVEQVREICIIDHSVMAGCLDNNSYEIIDDIDWYDVSERTLREHMFVGAEIVTSNILSNQLSNMFNAPLFCYDTNVNNAYVKPEDLSYGSKQYEIWVKLMTNISATKEKLGTISYGVINSCTPGCAAKELTVITTLGEWYDFFKKIKNSRMITNPDERKLTRIMADYFLDYAYIESFKTLLKELINSIDSYEELPF